MTSKGRPNMTLNSVVTFYIACPIIGTRGKYGLMAENERGVVCGFLLAPDGKPLAFRDKTSARIAGDGLNQALRLQRVSALPTSK